MLQSQYANDLPATGDASKVASILTSDGYTKVNGKWSKNGKTISFSVEDPISFSDFWLDTQLLTAQLNKLGFDAKADGIGNATNWFTDQATGNFDSMIRWSNNGPTPYYYYYNWMDNSTSAPLGKTAANNFGRFNDPQAQSALTQVREQHRSVHPAVGAEHAAGHHVHPDAGDPAAVRRVLGRVQHQELHRMAQPGQPVHRPGTQPDARSST